MKEVSSHKSNMEFAPGVVILLRACPLLLLLGCHGSRATRQPEGCPLIAPLSAYCPLISSEGSSPVTPRVAAELESTIAAFIANNLSPLYAVSVVHENQTVFTSGLATTPFMVGSIRRRSRPWEPSFSEREASCRSTIQSRSFSRTSEPSTPMTRVMTSLCASLWGMCQGCPGSSVLTNS